MYIGQKRNFWLVDLAHENSGVEEGKGGIEKIHIDSMKERVEALGDKRFVDELVAEGKDMMNIVFGA